jgi:hypothetical protein
MPNVKQNISKNNDSFLVKLSVWGIINIYRKYIKPYRIKKKNVLCSFYPDCSEYGILALKKYNFFTGWIKTIKRISRCTAYQHNESCIDFP